MYRNQEHYPDPTAGEAIRRAQRKEQRKMKFVYICSPYKAREGATIEQNLARANRFCLFAAKSGFVPVAPHVYFSGFLNDAEPDEREAGRVMGLCLLRRCEEMFVFGSYLSEGMRAEIWEAQARNIPIRYFKNNCAEVVR
jgi:hypothetical protein